MFKGPQQKTFVLYVPSFFDLKMSENLIVVCNQQISPHVFSIAPCPRTAPRRWLAVKIGVSQKPVPIVKESQLVCVGHTWLYITPEYIYCIFTK